MKKRILIPTIAAAAAGTCAMVIVSSANINNASAELNLNGDSLIAANTALSSTKQVSTSKDETVYVITDETGAAKTKFIGNTIYNGADELPFDFEITYYLDGNEISAKDLAGKSGHVEIVYSYKSTAQYLGKYVPFMAVTGLTLDSSNFTNLEIENGKIISSTSDNYLIAGYSVTGLDANLGTDLLPTDFVIEADVKDFKLGNTYTIFMNDVFADLDTSRLNDLDSLTNSITELSDGLDKIISGAGALADGLGSALDGAEALYAGSEQLAAGSQDALEGATNLSDSLNYITSTYNGDLQSGAKQVITSTIMSLAQKGINVTTDDYEEVLLEKIAMMKEYGLDTTELESALGLLKLSTGIIGYTSGVAQMAEKSPELVAGLTKISAGASELNAGLGSLVDGTTQLYEGSVTLEDGLNTFKTTGIDKLVSFATKDLQNFTANLRSTVNAAASYHSFGSNTEAKSVKFILKSPSI